MQWGYNQSYRAGVEYPISFTQIALGTFAQKNPVDTPAGITFGLTNLHGARVYGTGGADIEGYYIAVGVQQLRSGVLRMLPGKMNFCFLFQNLLLWQHPLNIVIPPTIQCNLHT